MDVFRPTRDGGATARLEAAEAVMLRGLIANVMDIIASGRPRGGSSATDLDDLLDPRTQLTAPDDPILARLLPDGYRDDPDAAGEFRRYTESSLRDAKREAGQTLLDTLPSQGGRVRLSADEAQAWLRALNDVRLAIGTKLDVTEDFEEQLAAIDPEDPRAAAFEVYGWLGAVQASLVQALM
jgi:Domain of unknown function (DUF2017)